MSLWTGTTLTAATGADPSVRSRWHSGECRGQRGAHCSDLRQVWLSQAHFFIRAISRCPSAHYMPAIPKQAGKEGYTAHLAAGRGQQHELPSYGNCQPQSLLPASRWCSGGCWSRRRCSGVRKREGPAPSWQLPRGAGCSSPRHLISPH